MRQHITPDDETSRILKNSGVKWKSETRLLYCGRSVDNCRTHSLFRGPKANFNFRLKLAFQDIVLFDKGQQRDCQNASENYAIFKRENPDLLMTMLQPTTKPYWQCGR
jgi:hypothetical protein